MALLQTTLKAARGVTLTLGSEGLVIFGKGCGPQLRAGILTACTDGNDTDKSTKDSTYCGLVPAKGT
jgi:hypothetical protein